LSFTIVRNDITKMKVDAVVNAANTELQMGGGACASIFYFIASWKYDIFEIDNVLFEHDQPLLGG